MNKIRVTKKEILKACKNIICVGYCDLQYLLYYKYADFYTCGVYGWNCDIYKINENLLISTGYSPFGNIRIDYKKTRKTEEKARAIVHDTKLSFEQKKKKLDNLLNKYIQEALKEIEQ